MKYARAKITDVGGLRGVHEVSFERGKVSTIEGSNSGGKSSMVQALTAVLSMPIDCDLDSFYKAEAIKLGVKTDTSSMKEGFVHVLAGTAHIILEYDDLVLEYIVDSKGNSKKCPNGTPGFLVAGVLSNRSKVVRQLRGQDDRYEPDDFKWAVTELSLSKRYEEVLSLVEGRRDETQSLHSLALKKSKENESLAKRHSEIERKLESLNRNISLMKEEYKTVSESLESIEKLKKKLAEWNEKKARTSADLKSIKTQSEKEKRMVEELETEAKTKLAEYKSIDLDELRRTSEEQEEDTKGKVTSLIKERDSLDGVLNLFVVAQSSIDKKGAKCPLCGSGHLTYSEVTKKVEELRSKKDSLSTAIGRLNLDTQQRKKEIQDKTAEKKQSWEEYGELHTKAANVKKDLLGHDAIISQLEFDAREQTTRIEEIRIKTSELSDKVGEGSKKAQQAFLKQEEEYKKLSDELAVTKQKLYETSVDIGVEAFPPDVAVSITEKWLDYYNALVDFTSEMSENQRRKASDQFNATIKDLLDRLGFKEFRTVMLNQEYRLYIERFDEKKKEYVFQQVKTLSTSEQMSIALILQMALKETYLPHIPFVIIDDILEDFDDDRRDEVVTYLGKKAKENDWFVISTKLVEGLDSIRVV